MGRELHCSPNNRYIILVALKFRTKGKVLVLKSLTFKLDAVFGLVVLASAALTPDAPLQG